MDHWWNRHDLGLILSFVRRVTIYHLVSLVHLFRHYSVHMYLGIALGLRFWRIDRCLFPVPLRIALGFHKRVVYVCLRKRACKRKKGSLIHALRVTANCQVHLRSSWFSCLSYHFLYVTNGQQRRSCRHSRSCRCCCIDKGRWCLYSTPSLATDATTDNRQIWWSISAHHLGSFEEVHQRLDQQDQHFQYQDDSSRVVWRESGARTRSILS